MTTESMKLVWLSDDALAKVWGRDSTPTVLTSTKCAANQHAAVLTRDMPVESLRWVLLLAKQRHESAAYRGDLTFAATTKQHIAALERLLGACEP